MRERRLEKSAAHICSLAGGLLDVAIVLGSGLAPALANQFAATPIKYDDLPGMPLAAVSGHPGELLVGQWGAKRVAAFAGRVHLYQGFSASDVVFGIHLAVRAGAKHIVLTNAAGALNDRFRGGDIMLITDHLNFTGASPLVGSAKSNPFLDLSDAYPAHLRAVAHDCAAKTGRSLQEGVYAGVLGPEYETPATARFLRNAGADAVGMSTVLETIAARSLGAHVLGLSVLTNVVGAEPASHDEVLQASRHASAGLAELLGSIVAELPS